MPNLCQTGGSLRLHYSSQLLPWLPELSQQALLYVLLLPGTEPTPTRLCPPAVCSPLRSFPSSRTKTKGKNLFIVIVLGLLSSEAPFNSVSSAEVYLSVLTRLQYTSPHLSSTLLPRLNSSLHPPKESSLHRFLRGHSFTGDLPGSGVGVGRGGVEAQCLHHPHRIPLPWDVSLSRQISPLPCKLPQHQHPNLRPHPKLPTPHTLAHAKARASCRGKTTLGSRNKISPSHREPSCWRTLNTWSCLFYFFPCNLYQLVWAAGRGPSSRSPCQAHVFGLWRQHLFVLHSSWNESTNRCPVTQVPAALQVLIKVLVAATQGQPRENTCVCGASRLEGSCTAQCSALIVMPPLMSMNPRPTFNVYWALKILWSQFCPRMTLMEVLPSFKAVSSQRPLQALTFGSLCLAHPGLHSLQGAGPEKGIHPAGLGGVLPLLWWNHRKQGPWGSSGSEKAGRTEAGRRPSAKLFTPPPRWFQRFLQEREFLLNWALSNRFKNTNIPEKVNTRILLPSTMLWTGSQALL